jgi:putative oxidoreductase
MDGWGKFHSGLAGVTAYMTKVGLLPATVFARAAMFLETIGAICIIVDLFRRFYAAALAIEIGIAFYAVNMAKGFSAGKGGYEYTLLLGIVMFSIAIRGGGRYSVDRAIGKEL